MYGTVVYTKDHSNRCRVAEVCTRDRGKSAGAKCALKTMAHQATLERQRCFSEADIDLKQTGFRATSEDRAPQHGQQTRQEQTSQDKTVQNNSGRIWSSCMHTRSVQISPLHDAHDKRVVRKALHASGERSALEQQENCPLKALV
jgi:hypothetical protein